jgi:hypothetical protein
LDLANESSLILALGLIAVLVLSLQNRSLYVSPMGVRIAYGKV